MDKSVLTKQLLHHTDPHDYFTSSECLLSGSVSIIDVLSAIYILRLDIVLREANHFAIHAAYRDGQSEYH